MSLELIKTEILVCMPALGGRIKRKFDEFDKKLIFSEKYRRIAKLGNLDFLGFENSEVSSRLISIFK